MARTSSSLITTNQYERGIHNILGMTFYTIALLALNTTMQKICAFFGGLGTAMIGWILAVGGYDSYAAVQSASARAAIKFSFSWAPLIFVVITLVCFLLYRLDKEYAAYEKDLSEGRYGPDAVRMDE